MTNKPIISCFLEAWNAYVQKNNTAYDALSDFTEQYVITMLDESLCDEIIREFSLKALIDLMCTLEEEETVYEQLLHFSKHKTSWTEEALIRSALDAAES
jgi:hypothetical protein